MHAACCEIFTITWTTLTSGDDVFSRADLSLSLELPRTEMINEEICF